MSPRPRNVLADILVAVAVLLVLVWVLRSVLGTIVWFANLLSFLLVVIGLLVVAGLLRRR